VVSGLMVLSYLWTVSYVWLVQTRNKTGAIQVLNKLTAIQSLWHIKWANIIH